LRRMHYVESTSSKVSRRFARAHSQPLDGIGTLLSDQTDLAREQWHAQSWYALSLAC
jgi:hypothetical protein